MINSKDLIQDIRPRVQILDGTGIDGMAVQRAIEEKANAYGIPVAFYQEELRVGGIGGAIGIGGKIENVLVLYHPEHKRDYFNFVVRLSRQGTALFITVDGYGKSKLMNAEESRQRISAYAGANFKSAVFGNGNSFNMTNAILTGIVGGGKKLFGALTGAKAKLEAEENWYSLVGALFEEILR